MYSIIYCQPLWQVVLEMAAGLAAWSALGVYMNRRPRRARIWQWLNILLAVLAVAGIAYITVFSRGAGAGGAELRPFHSFEAALVQPEIYRTMLMNVFLFEPLGLTLAHALPGKWAVWARVVVTVCAGLLLSCTAEALQYAYALGVAETDDVLCNACGVLIGALSLFGYSEHDNGDY